MFAEHYPQLIVKVRSAERVEGGIEVRGLSISQPGVSGPMAELAYFDELSLTCRNDLPTLVREPPVIKKLIVRRPTIRATRRPDGSWTVAQLFPLPKFGDKAPLILVESGVLELSNPQANPPQRITLRDVQLQVDADPSPAPRGQAPRLRVKGHLAGDHLQRAQIDGSFDRTGGGWKFSGVVDRLDLSPELVRGLPGELAQKAPIIEALRGQAKVHFAAAYVPRAQPALQFHVAGHLERGRLDDHRLAYPLTDLKASFRFNHQGFAIDELTANSGPAQVRLDLERAGYGEKAPMSLAAEATHLQLTPQLRGAFPVEWQDVWDKFSPSGEIDLDVKLRYDGQAWDPDVTVECHDVAFTYKDFPYRLEHAIGVVTLRDRLLKVDLKAFSDSEEISIYSEVNRPGPDWDGYLQVKASNLPVDQKLLTALPEKPRAIVESLRPRGNVGLFVKYDRPPVADAKLQRFILINLLGGEIKYEAFPYPLTNVKGTVEISNDEWTFDGLNGTNDTALIQCKGKLLPAPSGHQLELEFFGWNVPLEEELREALPKSARKLWIDMRPRGTVTVKANVSHVAGSGPPKISLSASPVGESASIEPVYFPYRLEKVRGDFKYRDGHLRLEGLEGEHGRGNRIAARGFCQVDPRGGWRLCLQNLTAGRLFVDRDLLDALPARLKKPVTDLRLAGPINMYGSLDLSSSGVAGEPITAGWNLNFDLQQVRLHCGLPLENVNGSLTLTGAFDGRRMHTLGELAIDSVNYKDLQLTELRGPLSIDDDRVLLGCWAAPARDGQPARSVTSKVFGGIVVADGWVMLESTPRYNVDARITGADLARCAQECVSGPRELRGKVAARVNLHGQGSGIDQLGGNGQIELREANVYELPVMASMLKIISARPPSPNAFDRSDIDFKIEGKHVYLDRVDFNGDAFSLKGRGELDVDKNVRLTFYAIPGRDEIRVPLVSELFGGASQNLLLIQVAGTLDRPDVRKEALPMVKEALQQLQADLQNPAFAPTERPAQTNRQLFQRR